MRSDGGGDKICFGPKQYLTAETRRYLPFSSSRYFNSLYNVSVSGIFAPALSAARSGFPKIDSTSMGRFSSKSIFMLVRYGGITSVYDSISLINDSSMRWPQARAPAATSAMRSAASLREWGFLLRASVDADSTTERPLYGTFHTSFFQRAVPRSGSVFAVIPAFAKSAAISLTSEVMPAGEPSLVYWAMVTRPKSRMVKVSRPHFVHTHETENAEHAVRPHDLRDILFVADAVLHHERRAVFLDNCRKYAGQIVVCRGLKGDCNHVALRHAARVVVHVYMRHCEIAVF